MEKYIIFAPHYHCVSSVRDCDLRAGQAARLIYDGLIAAGIATENIIRIEHDISRDDYDLNRFRSRDTAPRQKLRTEMLKLYNDPSVTKIYFLEMHSFPRNWEQLNEKIGLVNRIETSGNGAILAEDMGGCSAGVRAHIGSEHIDLQHEFVSGRDKIIPFMFEVNELRDVLSDRELKTLLESAAKRIVRGFTPVAKGAEIIIVGENVHKLLSLIANNIGVVVLIVLVILFFWSTYRSTYRSTYQSTLKSQIVGHGK